MSFAAHIFTPKSKCLDVCYHVVKRPLNWQHLDEEERKGNTVLFRPAIALCAQPCTRHSPLSQSPFCTCFGGDEVWYYCLQCLLIKKKADLSCCDCELPVIFYCCWPCVYTQTQENNLSHYYRGQPKTGKEKYLIKKKITFK